MGKLLDNIVNIFRDGKNQLADKLADPIRDGKLAIEDAEKQIGVLSGKAAAIGRESNLLQEKVANAKQDADKYDRIAKAAAAAGNVDDVKTAAQAKHNAENQATTYQGIIDKNAATAKTILSQITELEGKIEEAKSNMARLEASITSDKLREESAKADVLGQSKTTFSSLDAIKHAADTAKASADAWETTKDSLHPVEKLEEKYGAASSPVDASVAEYLKEAAAKKAQ